MIDLLLIMPHANKHACSLISTTGTRRHARSTYKLFTQSPKYRSHLHAAASPSTKPQWYSQAFCPAEPTCSEAVSSHRSHTAKAPIMPMMTPPKMKIMRHTQAGMIMVIMVKTKAIHVVAI